ncbi:hypothetical protein [Crateriforma conspicua]|uniref:hypothetical protein n=1 Tax=Crateriforma conspicua TaxID=2527996 RepID=UPI001187B0A2|nr:hypothetical protein [Crateriforma conspicua]QDV66161.1 hypothetical protein Mal65_53360 [Crateriforma conspicua]
MSTTDKFFQFPIAALRTDKRLDEIDEHEKRRTIGRIIDYSIQHVAFTADGLSSEDVEAAADNYCESNPSVTKPPSRWKRQILYAADILGVSYSGDPNYNATRDVFNEINTCPGGDRQVRVRTDLVWSARDEESWTFRQFAVLAAIYAGVGANKKARLSFDYIAAMACGCSTMAEYDQHVPPENRMSRRQVRWTVESLDDRGLFARATPDGRRMHYSMRLSKPELMTMLAEELAKKEAKRSNQRAATAKIREHAEHIRNSQSGA